MLQDHVTSFNCKSAKLPGKSSPCTNIPIACPSCDSSSGPQFIWKYNAVTHMAPNHTHDRLSLNFVAQIHISLTEVELMKGDTDGMKSYRMVHSLIGSDDLPEEIGSTTRDTRSRVFSASSAVVRGKIIDSGSRAWIAYMIVFVFIYWTYHYIWI